MLKTWQAYFFSIIIFVFIFILCWCRVTLVGVIKRQITIHYFKRLAAYIILAETMAA